MCGFVGFVDKKSKKEKKEIIKEMSDRIIHRGPDSEGIYVDDTIALGFRRLGIIDLEGGNQPIYSEDKTKLIFFNGAIYNFKELRKELEKKKHVFATDTDTEVVLHGFEEYGCDIVKKLRGMFAFLIWDLDKKELFGARDHFGIKPFYYTFMNGTFMFGSEIKSFMVHPDFKRDLNEMALKPYLTFQCSILPETFFKGVYKLDPGHYFIYKDELKITKYYEIDFEIENKSMEEYTKLIKETVSESVDCHKTCDVKVGSFLSGGVDSSYITKVLMPNKTFSVGFANKGFSEVDYAKELSDMLEIENVSKIITPEEFFGKLEEIQYHCDDPHANLSTVPLYFLSELTRKDVTVVLSGEGSDELFGGYISYGITKSDERYRKVPKFIRYPLGKLAATMPKFHGKNFLTRNGLPVEEYYIGQAFIFDEKEKKKVLKNKFWKGLDYKEITKPYFDKVKDKDDVTKMQYVDMHLWLPHDILLKADKMTMAHSLELRVPFLDRIVFDLASKIPTKYEIKDNTTKYIMRKCAYDILPEEWAKRPKVGFPVPFFQWIREEKYYKIVKDEFNKDYVDEFFDKNECFKLLEEHYNGSKNNGRKIWTMYAFLLWYKVYFIEQR